MMMKLKLFYLISFFAIFFYSSGNEMSIYIMFSI